MDAPYPTNNVKIAARQSYFSPINDKIILIKVEVN